MAAPAKITVFCGYVRVSTDKQEKEGCSLAVQSQLIAEYATKNKLNLIWPCFQDVITGSSDPEERGGIRQLRNELKGEATGIICCKQDRLGRSFSTQTFMNKLKEEGVELIILDSLGIDTSTPVGALMTSVKGALNQFELDTIRRRVQESIDVRRRNGEQIGPVPFGKRLLLDGTKRLLVADPVQTETIAIVKKLRAQTTTSKKGKIRGMSYVKICAELVRLERRTRSGDLVWYPSMIKPLLDR